MTRLEEAYARRTKVRTIEEDLERFVVACAAKREASAIIFVETLLANGFEALIALTRSTKETTRIASRICQLVCKKHNC